MSRIDSLKKLVEERQELKKLIDSHKNLLEKLNDEIIEHVQKNFEEQTVTVDIYKVSVVNKKFVNIENKKKVPEKYMKKVPDKTKISFAVSNLGEDVPGVSIYTKDVLVIKEDLVK